MSTQFDKETLHVYINNNHSKSRVSLVFLSNYQLFCLKAPVETSLGNSRSNYRFAEKNW